MIAAVAGGAAVVGLGVIGAISDSAGAGSPALASGSYDERRPDQHGDDASDRAGGVDGRACDEGLHAAVRVRRHALIAGRGTG